MKISVRTQLYAYTLVALLLTALSISLADVIRFQGEYKKALTDRSFTVAQNLRETVLNNLRFFPLNSFTGMTEYLQQTLQANEGISYIYIADPNGKILYHNDETQAGKQLDSSIYIDTVSNKPTARTTLTVGNYYELIIPIVSADIVTGTIHIGVERKLVDSQVVGLISQSAVILIIALLIFTYPLYLLLSRNIVNPLSKLTETALRTAAGDLTQQVQMTRQDEIGKLGEAFNTMTTRLRNLIGSLEQRVAERTTELEQRSKDLADHTVALELANVRIQKRAAQFQAIAQVGKAITSIQNLEELLPYITQVVSEQLGYYHVGIFSFDKNKEYAILSAANSEGGKRMLERGHKLKVGQEGIVGYVASLNKARIALDTGADAVFFDNPDLPNTHSELGLPLNIGSKIIGVLDVQSEQPSAFEQEDVELLTVLAEQVSLAIQNSQRFEETQKAMTEVEAISKQYLRQEWQSIAQEGENLGYRLTNNKLEPLANRFETADIIETSKSGQLKLVKEQAQNRLTIPVKLRGEVIGVLNLQSSGGRAWKNDVIDIAQAIADRVALAMENARLLESSQNQAARERTVGEITSKIGASVNLRNVLQTAVEELGRILPGSDVVIQIESAKRKE